MNSIDCADVSGYYTAKARVLRTQSQVAAVSKGVEQAVRFAKWLIGQTARMIKHLHSAYENRRAIRQLQAMSDWQLKDIGITRTEIPAAVRGLYRPAPVTQAPVVGSNEYLARVKSEDAANDPRRSAA